MDTLVKVLIVIAVVLAFGYAGHEDYQYEKAQERAAAR